jgi:uncharacterized membrane protein
MGERDSPIARWEWGLVALAVCAALVLGFANAGTPSLWHDELVHVFVAKQTLDTGVPQQLSGRFYPSGLAYSYVLAAFIGVFGDSETAVRAPSTLAAGLNVVLLFLVLRPLLGRATALTAAWSLAVFPWSVAWSREARFYSLHQTTYLCVMLFTWRALAGSSAKSAVRYGVAGVLAYIVGILTALHSTLFTIAAGINGAMQALAERRLRSRGLVVFLVCVVAGAVTTAAYLAALPQADYDAIFKEGGIGGQTVSREIDPQRSERAYYFIFLAYNLSLGYFALAFFGFPLMVIREHRRGLFVALAFWIPLFALTFLIGYRMFRFMFFAYPFYVAAHAYAMCWLAGFVWQARGNVWRSLAAALVVAFGCRIAVSTVSLIASSLAYARGADVTLARRHPQWREPCQYVRERLRESDAVITTTYVAALYYVGRCDDWFPSRMLPWEHIDSGSYGLEGIGDLQRFIAENPSGYFLAERRRFRDAPSLQADWAWVEQNLQRINAASNEDITVYAWGIDRD